MCGIAGISLNPNDTKLNVAVATAELLRGIASRGGDATGAAWYDHETDSVKLTKVATNVARFLGARQEAFPETTPVMILHTRYATTGDKSNRLNNHPIQYSNIIGVHNGVLWDHEGLFKELDLKPHAQVDSEAIMALLSTAKRPDKVLADIPGDAALAWIDLYDPEVLHLARVVDRPLILGQTTEGSLIFASTLQAVRDAATAAKVEIEFELEVPEAHYLKVVGGTIAEYLPIPGVKINRAWSSKYAYTSGTGSTGSKGMKPAPKGIPVTNKVQAKPAVNKGSEDAFAEWAKVDNAAEAIARMATDKLVDLVKDGSVAALDQLYARGLDAKGHFKRFIPDADVIALAETHDLWANGQLYIRKIGKGAAGGNTENRARSWADCTLDELVTQAAGGSIFAKDELNRRGYDVVGKALPEKQAVSVDA